MKESIRLKIRREAEKAAAGERVPLAVTLHSKISCGMFSALFLFYWLVQQETKIAPFLLIITLAAHGFAWEKAAGKYRKRRARKICEDNIKAAEDAEERIAAQRPARAAAPF